MHFGSLLSVLSVLTKQQIQLMEDQEAGTTCKMKIT